MSKKLTRRSRVSGIRRAILMTGAVILLITYPLGVLWTLLTAQGVPELSLLGRIWYALGWPLIAFLALMDEANKHLPHPLD